MSAKDVIGQLGGVEVRAVTWEGYKLVQLAMYEGDGPDPSYSVVLNPEAAMKLAGGIADALIALQP